MPHVAELGNGRVTALQDSNLAKLLNCLPGSCCCPTCPLNIMTAEFVAQKECDPTLQVVWNSNAMARCVCTCVWCVSEFSFFQNPVVIFLLLNPDIYTFYRQH